MTDPKNRSVSKREAKRLICRAAAAILDNDSSNDFLYERQDGEMWDETSGSRIREAFRELIAELQRRGSE